MKLALNFSHSSLTTPPALFLACGLLVYGSFAQENRMPATNPVNAIASPGKPSAQDGKWTIRDEVDPLTKEKRVIAVAIFSGLSEGKASRIQINAYCGSYPYANGDDKFYLRLRLRLLRRSGSTETPDPSFPLVVRNVYADARNMGHPEITRDAGFNEATFSYIGGSYLSSGDFVRATSIRLQIDSDELGRPIVEIRPQDPSFQEFAKTCNVLAPPLLKEQSFAHTITTLHSDHGCDLPPGSRVMVDRIGADGIVLVSTRVDLFSLFADDCSKGVYRTTKDNLKPE